MKNIPPQKIAIFSDSHLTTSFNLAKFNFLKKMIESVDQVIINGDFWDGFACSFDEFVNSGWRQLFPLLKKKQAIYLYGNHDYAAMSDERVGLFCVAQAKEWELQIKLAMPGVNTQLKTLKILHGHQVVPSWDVKYARIYQNRPMMKLGSALQAGGVGIFRDKFLWLIFAEKNYRAKKWTKNPANLAENEILVCGHTHLAELDLTSRYINHGVVRWGIGQYLLIEGEQMELVSERY